MTNITWKYEKHNIYLLKLSQFVETADHLNRAYTPKCWNISLQPSGPGSSDRLGNGEFWRANYSNLAEIISRLFCIVCPFFWTVFFCRWNEAILAWWLSCHNWSNSIDAQFPFWIKERSAVRSRQVSSQMNFKKEMSINVMLCVLLTHLKTIYLPKASLNC